MRFWETGTQEVIIGTLGGILTIALVTKALSNADGISKILTGGASAVNSLLKTAMGNQF